MGLNNRFSDRKSTIGAVTVEVPDGGQEMINGRRINASSSDLIMLQHLLSN